MPDHTGRRRKQSRLPLRRISVLILAVAAIGALVSLPEPRWALGRGEPIAVAPVAVGAESVSTPARLADGTPYTPRIFLTASTSVGTAPTRDGASVRLVARTGNRLTQLRTVAAAEQPQFAGFAAAGDTVVWAESLSGGGTSTPTTLWRAEWRTAGSAAAITSATGEPSFYGGQFDTVVHGGRVYWASARAGGTEVRSVGLKGGNLTAKRFKGDLALTTWPFAVSVDGGRGRPVTLVNYDTGERTTLPTGAQETATCSARWCRIGVLGAESLDRIDLVRPDGSGRRRIAGGEATPTLVDVALLDRFVPLATDRAGGSEQSGVGLSLYDVTTGQTDLIAIDVADVHGSDEILWWSTGSGADLTWHAIDLRTLA